MSRSASGTRDSRESSLGSFENAEQGADEDDDRLDDEDAGGALVKSEVGAKAQSEELVELHYVDSQADEALDSEDPVDDGRDWDLENSDCEVDSDEDGNHDEEDDYDVARQVSVPRDLVSTPPIAIGKRTSGKPIFLRPLHFPSPDVYALEARLLRAHASDHKPTTSPLPKLRCRGRSSCAVFIAGLWIVPVSVAPVCCLTSSNV